MGVMWTQHATCDVKIGFDESRHAYEDETGRTYVSVTQFSAHYMPHFDADAVAARISSRDGRPESEIKAEWEKSKDYACGFGTLVHENQEAMMNGAAPKNMPKDERERGIMAAGYNALCALAADGWRPIGAERVVFSPYWRIAGTVDALFARGREIMIADWKTNKTIRMVNTHGEKCLPPIAELDACELVKYSLQVSLYQRILLRERYINQLAHVVRRIIHLKPDGFEMIDVDFMKTETAEMILDFLEKQWDLDEPPF